MLLATLAAAKALVGAPVRMPHQRHQPIPLRLFRAYDEDVAVAAGIKRERLVGHGHVTAIAQSRIGVTRRVTAQLKSHGLLDRHVDVLADARARR